MQSEDSETAENLKLLDEIASLELGKNAQIAARKISQKYKKLREAKRKYEISDEIVKVLQAEINVPISLKKQKRSGKKTAKKLIKKYDRIRREKAYQKLVDTREKRKKQKKIELTDEIKDAAAKKNNRIVAKKILDKCKRMKRPKKKIFSR